MHQYIVYENNNIHEPIKAKTTYNLERREYLIKHLIMS
jgi:hypothetical protein